MKKILVILSIIIIVINCKRKPDPFEYTLSVKIIGRDSGEICFFESPRVGDEVIVPFKNGVFNYQGKASEIMFSSFAFYEDLQDGSFMPFPIVIEPGVIEIELDADNIRDKSRILNGEINLSIQNVNKITNRYWDSVFIESNSSEEINNLLKNVYSDSVFILIEDNVDSYAGIYLLNRYSVWEIFNESQLEGLFEKIQKPDLRRSTYFKEVYSGFLANKNELNKIGTKALDFSLPDSTGRSIYFHDINKNKMVFVESSGSWCGNQTRETHELDPIYEKYRNKGFEIVTVVLESKYDRWINWVRSEKLPWVNVIELEFGNTNDVFYSHQIFRKGDYLVDEEGIVVANNISPAKLNEILMEKYEPEKYQEYLSNKWSLPKGTYILDKEIQINTFEDLALQFSGKAFFIDCWATWCSPCIEEFKYIEPLKEYLKNNELEMVYISFDRNLDDEKWLSFIKDYNLSGYHMRANEKFRADFVSEVDWNNRIPVYLIVNENGEIVEKDALCPSEKDRLFKQIETKLSN